MCIFTLRLPHNRLKSGTDGLCRSNLFPVERAPIFISEQMAESQTRKQDKKHFQKNVWKTKLPFQVALCFFHCNPWSTTAHHMPGEHRQFAVWQGKLQSVRECKSLRENRGAVFKGQSTGNKRANLKKKVPERLELWEQGIKRIKGPSLKIWQQTYTHKCPPTTSCMHVLDSFF